VSDEICVITLVGKACLLNVLNDSKKSVISGVMALPKETTPPKGKRPQRAFFLDEWNEEVFDALPEGLQKLIRKSDEYRSIKAKGGNEESEVLLEELSGGAAENAQEEKIPF
jgi:hypothetical protein